MYGIEDGVREVPKKTKLRFANSKTKMSTTKAYLKCDVFGKRGEIEAAVVPGNMGLLFSRKCVGYLDITPRLKTGRTFFGEQQKATVMTTMMNGHAVIPVFPGRGQEEEFEEGVTSVEEALKNPLKKKQG